MSSIHSILVTGSNRGIGLELIKELASLGSSKITYLIAACRNPEKADQLNLLAKQHENLTVLKLDVKDYANYDEFYNQVSSIVGDKGLNMLINNAGILIVNDFENVTREQMLENFEVNVVTPLLLSQKLLPLLKLSGQQNKARTLICNVSSKIASIDDNTSGGRYPYRVSKTALNQVSRSMSVDLLKYKIQTVSVHPGWVLTDMGGPNALIDVQTSVSGMLKYLLDENSDLNGKFLNYDGTEIAW